MNTIRRRARTLIATAAASPARPASFRLNSTTPSVSVPEDQSSAETVSSLKATRKTISAETTFNDDLHRLSDLEDMLWPLCEKVARQARAEGAFDP